MLARVSCAGCESNQATVGVLCLECAEKIPRVRTIAPEQVLDAPSVDTSATLIDGWGRPHGVAREMWIGRVGQSGPTLLVLDHAVSRAHAKLVESITPTGSQWELFDLSSANGVTVNEEQVSRATLSRGDVIGIGPFFTMFSPAHISPRPTSHAEAFQTVRPENPSPIPGLVPLFANEVTGDGLPLMDVQLIEPTGGGGGLVILGSTEIQLPVSQFELFAVLCKRMSAEADISSRVRGFVRGSELLADVSWETPNPDENHIKQLVRRLRRTLDRGGVGDVIESRHRFGYRVRFCPSTRLA